MTANSYLRSLDKALRAELMQRGGNDSGASTRRHGRTIAALLLGATAVVATGDESAAVSPSVTVARTEASTAAAPVMPASFRAAKERRATSTPAVVSSRKRTRTSGPSVAAVATLALEIGRLQRDVASRSPEGMEEWIGEAYASLEAVRRAIADAVIDDEDGDVMSVALDRATQLLIAAA